MTDGYGRKINYLRLSVTDKCNLRCRYCMPEEGIRNLLHSDVLSFEEIQRLVGIMNELGIEKVRLTGGEPLVRKGIVSLVEMLGGDVYMTTNGCMLSEYATALKEAGLSGVNISLDTLDADRFKELTGRDELGRVLEGIDAAASAGIPVKLNCVPIRGVNDGELEELCDFARRSGFDIRFIELMPIGCAKGHTGIPSDEIIKRLGLSVSGSPGDDNSVSGPARYYRQEGSGSRIGFISPMSYKFCSTCNRIRLTADGFLKTCLQYSNGTDLRMLLRSGADNDTIRRAIETALKNKPLAHSFGNDNGSDTRRMVQIGG